MRIKMIIVTITRPPTDPVTDAMTAVGVSEELLLPAPSSGGLGGEGGLGGTGGLGSKKPEQAKETITRIRDTSTTGRSTRWFTEYFFF